MNRKSRRSSILKPPKPITKSPLRDINCLPRDENDDHDTQPNIRRVSFSRKSHVKEFDPTITYMEQWNKSHEESLNSTNDENQPESCGLPYIHSMKMSKRKRTSSVQLSLNTSNSGAVGGECSSTGNVESRIAKQARKSLPALGASACGKGDMSEFYDELDVTKSMDCTSASISTNFSVTLVGEDSFNFPEPTRHKGRKSVSNNDPYVIKPNSTSTNQKTSEQDSKAARKGSHDRNSIANYGPGMPMLNSTLIPSKNAVIFDPGMDLTMTCGGIQDSENGPGNFYDESTAGMDTTLKQSLGFSPQEKLKLVAKIESPCDNGDDMDCTLAAGLVEVVQNYDTTPVKTEHGNRSRLSTEAMKLALSTEKVKNERHQIEDSGLCVLDSNVKEAKLLSKKGLAIDWDLNEAPAEKKAHLSIPESNEEMGSGDNGIIQEKQSTCSVVDGMDFTVPLGKLKVSSSGSSNVDLSVGGCSNECKEQMMISRVDSSEMEFTLVGGGSESVGDGNETIVCDQTTTNNISADTSSMNLTCAIGQVPEKAEHSLKEEAVAESGAQEETVGTDQVEEVCQPSETSSGPLVDLPISNSESSNQGAENINTSQISENINSSNSDMEGMDLTVPLGKIQQKLPKEPVASPVSGDNDSVLTTPVTINVSGEGNTTLHSQSMDETCADMEGMELTVPLGQLKVNKMVEHSEKEIDSVFNNDVISSGETPLEETSPATLEMAGDKDDTAHGTENSTIMKDCETLNETCGMEFTVPLGKLKEKRAESIVASMVNGVEEAVGGDVTINENFEALDETCRGEDGMELTVPVGRIKEKNEDVSTIDIEGSTDVMSGKDLIINETVECVDKTCDVSNGIAFKVLIEEECKNASVSTMDTEGAVDVTNGDVTITDNAESLDETCGVGSGMDFTVPLGRIKEKTRLSPILSMDDEGSLELKDDNVTINENFEALDETCGAENGMELTVPLGRIKEKSEATIADMDNRRAAAMVSGHFSMTENVDFIDQTCVAESEMELNATLEKMNEENGDSCNSSIVIGEPVEVSNGNITVNDNVESLDETCGVGNGMDFTVPLGRIKEKAEQVVTKNLQEELADQVTHGDVTISENFETLDETCADDNEAGLKLSLEKSEGGIEDVPMSNTDVEGAVEVSNGNITINDNVESLDETCGFGNGMDFTVPLGRIKEKAEQPITPNLHEELADQVTHGDVTINENFETIDETYAEDNEAGLKLMLEKSEGGIEDVPMSIMDVEGAVEVSNGNITVNDNVESLDETCGVGNGMDFTVPLGRIKEKAEQPITPNLQEELADQVAHGDVTINENFETLDETCADDNEAGLKLSLEKSEGGIEDVPMSNMDVEGAVEVSSGNITVNDNVESLDETCGFGNGMDFTVPLGRIKEKAEQAVTKNLQEELADQVAHGDITINENFETLDETCADDNEAGLKLMLEKSELGIEDVPMSNTDVEGAVDVSNGNITVNDNVESLDETCGVGNGMDFTVPLGRIKEKAEQPITPNLHEELADQVTRGDVTMNENFKTLDETCADDNGAGLKLMLEKSEGGIEDVPMSSMDVEGAVDVSNGNITVNDNMESLDETCGVGNGMDLTIPLGRIREKNQVGPVASLDDVAAVEVRTGDISVSENFETLDETCADDNEAVLKLQLEKSSGGIEEVPMPSMDVEVTRGDVTIDENVESLYETCGADNGLDSDASFKKIAEEDKEIPISSMDVEDTVDVTNEDVPISEKFETIDETREVENAPEFTVSLDKTLDKNEDNLVSSVNNEVCVESANGNATISENHVSLDETCGLENGMDFTVPLGRIKEKALISSVDIDDTAELVAKSGDITVGESCETVHPNCETDGAINGEGEPDGLLAMKSTLNETLTSDPRDTVNILCSEVEMPSGDVLSEDSCNRFNETIALDSLPNEESPPEDVGMDMSIANENLESHNNGDVTNTVTFTSDSSPVSEAIAESEDCLKESEVIDEEPMKEDPNHSTTLVEMCDPEKSFSEIPVPLETMEVPEDSVPEKSITDAVTFGVSPDVNEPIAEENADMCVSSDILEKDVAESVPPVAVTESKVVGLKSPVPVDRIPAVKISDEIVLLATEGSIHEEVVTEIQCNDDGNDSVDENASKNTSFVGEGEPEVPAIKHEQLINVVTLENQEEPGIPAEDIKSAELTTTSIAMKVDKMLNDENVCDENDQFMDNLVKIEPKSEADEAKGMGLEFATPLESPRVCKTEIDDEAIVTPVPESVQVVDDFEENRDEEMDVDRDPLVENQMIITPSTGETPSNEVDMDSLSSKETFEVEIPDKLDESLDVSLQVDGKIEEAIGNEDLDEVEGNITVNMDCLSKQSEAEKVPSVGENHCEAVDFECSREENLHIEGECLASELGICTNINSSLTPEITPVPENMDLSISEEIGLADDDPLSKPQSNLEVLNGTNSHSSIIPENGSSSILNINDENALTNDKSVCESAAQFHSDADVKCSEMAEGNITCEILPAENSIISHSVLSNASLEKIAINKEASAQNITFRTRRSGSTHHTKPHVDTSDHEEERIIETDSDGVTEVSQLCESENDSTMEALDKNEEDEQDSETEMETDSSDNSYENSLSETLNKSAENAPPILSREWIEKELEKKTCKWVIKELLDDQLSFIVLRRTVELTVNLKPLENNENSAAERAVENVVMKSTMTKRTGACIELVNRLFLNKFPSNVLSSKCTSVSQLSSFLNFLDAELDSFEDLLEQIRKMFSRSPADLLTDSFSFKVVSMKLLLFFEVQVSLRNWENGHVKPEDVTMRNVIGKTQLSDIREVVQGVNRDSDYLFNIYEAVLDFVRDLEKLID